MQIRRADRWAILTLVTVFPVAIHLLLTLKIGGQVVIGNVNPLNSIDIEYSKSDGVMKGFCIPRELGSGGDVGVSIASSCRKTPNFSKA
jgi:hypothetical protein